jgi:hypothetical protein
LIDFPSIFAQFLINGYFGLSGPYFSSDFNFLWYLGKKLSRLVKKQIPVDINRSIILIFWLILHQFSINF